MNRLTMIAIAAAAVAVPAAAAVQRDVTSDPGTLTFYQLKNYSGEDFEIDSPRRQLRLGWVAYSIAVPPGERWQICNKPQFREPCVVIDRSVPDTNAIGAAGEIASARPMPAEGR